VNTLRTILMTVAVGLLFAVAVPAIADTEIPEEWIGVWQLDIAIYDCDTNIRLYSSAPLDTICPGSVFEDPDGGDFTIECTASAGATTYTTHCEGSSEVEPGCIANFMYDVTGTRDGDSYSSTAITTIAYTGDCPLIPDSCQRIEISGIRISSDLGPCDSTPVESRPWATVKAFYR